MENSPKKLTYKELQALLPDYAFNRLDKESAELFENSISDYPELKRELAEINAVFDKVNKFNFKSYFEQNAKNISVNVQNQFNRTPPDRTGFGYFSKIIVPTLGLAAIVIVLIITGLQKDKKSLSNEDGTNKSKIDMMITPQEAMVIFENFNEITEDNEFINTISNIKWKTYTPDFQTILSADYKDLYVDLYWQFFTSIVESDEITEYLKNYNHIHSYYQLQENFDLIDEEFMQQILEELRNANFS